MSTTLDIIDVRRTALRLGVPVSRVLDVMNELGMTEVRVNALSFHHAEDEQRIEQRIEEQR
jgi:hypothetical protein